MSNLTTELDAQSRTTDSPRHALARKICRKLSRGYHIVDIERRELYQIFVGEGRTRQLFFNWIGDFARNYGLKFHMRHGYVTFEEAEQTNGESHAND